MIHAHHDTATARYKKVTKPLLERKRRARINRCLDQLKDLVQPLLQLEGDNVNKLEKADILELTVRHLTALKNTGPSQQPPTTDRTFQAGFGRCAAEACQFIAKSMPEEDADLTETLLRHLATALRGPAPPERQLPAPQEQGQREEIMKKIREQILERRGTRDYRRVHPKKIMLRDERAFRDPQPPHQDDMWRPW